MSLILNQALAAKVLGELRQSGYSIARNVVPIEQVNALKVYGLELVKQRVAEDVVWDPYIGERDKVCYSDDHFQCMYRGYAFPWNAEANGVGFDIFDRLNSFRLSLARNLNSNQHLQIKDIYTTWSYYPSGRGWLKAHKDSVYSDSFLLHYIIPLTFKGSDFEEGGLFLTDKLGNVVDVDANMKCGDVLFFDGNCTHEVRRIASKNDIGRMQAFAIPVAFKYPDQSERFLGQLPLLRIIKIKLTAFLKRTKAALLG